MTLPPLTASSISIDADEWPRRYRRAAQQSERIDTAFFKANRDTVSYERAIIPGEFGPDPALDFPPGTKIGVIRRGYHRMRLPLIKSQNAEAN